MITKESGIGVLVCLTALGMSINVGNSNIYTVGIGLTGSGIFQQAALPVGAPASPTLRTEGDSIT